MGLAAMSAHVGSRRSSLADEHARREHGDARRRVHGARRALQRARRPPRVVVAQGHVGRIEQAQADVARRRAMIAIEGEDLDVAMTRTHGRDRAVARAVVDHDDGRALGKGRQPRQGGQQPLAAVAGDDDDGNRGRAQAHALPTANPR